MISINRNRVQNFPFHLVEVSPWPILVSFSLLTMAISAVMYMHRYQVNYFYTWFDFYNTVRRTFVTDALNLILFY